MPKIEPLEPLRPSDYFRGNTRSRGARLTKGEQARLKAAYLLKRAKAEADFDAMQKHKASLGDSFKEQMQSPWTLVLVGIIGYSAGRAIAKSEEAEAFAKLSNSYSKISALTTGTPLKGLNGCGCDY
jgi:hypothetical protein